MDDQPPDDPNRLSFGATDPEILAGAHFAARNFPRWKRCVIRWVSWGLAISAGSHPFWDRISAAWTALWRSAGP